MLCCAACRTLVVKVRGLWKLVRLQIAELTCLQQTAWVHMRQVSNLDLHSHRYHKQAPAVEVCVQLECASVVEMRVSEGQ